MFRWKRTTGDILWIWMNKIDSFGPKHTSCIPLMELPPISTPCATGPLRYPSDYQRAMTVLGRKDWPTLKNRLSCDGADQVVAALNAYVAAFVANQEAIDTHDAFDCQFFPSTDDRKVLEQRWDNIDKLRRACRYALRDQRLTRYDLMALLVGKENLCFERPDDYSDTDYDVTDEEYPEESECESEW